MIISLPAARESCPSPVFTRYYHLPTSLKLKQILGFSILQGSSFSRTIDIRENQIKTPMVKQTWKEAYTGMAFTIFTSEKSTIIFTFSFSNFPLKYDVQNLNLSSRPFTMLFTHSLGISEEYSSPNESSLLEVTWV